MWVLQAMPGPLTEVLGRRGGVPHTVVRLVEQQLLCRTADELRERIERRWFKLFSNLSGPELVRRGDQLAWDLLAPGECPSPACEDGWLRDDSGSCPRCRKASSVIHMTDVDQRDAPPASPQYAAMMAEGMRDQRRREHGLPRGQRSRHVVKQHVDYTPEPYELREPEPELPTEDQVERARDAERAREVQRLAAERARAEKKTRARQTRREGQP
ncbi:hypothetical protein DN069_09020 [Streptacidiphilus pinicola]|uniref:Uncharacterized protein n=1 Tax=Streptacidiphilus pinicola TaxID=2219663 RepID=A0A2X0JE98_9ACTN|nr:hypothetical protein [Streptacidiphilus pinicola]RAG85908.1 hypothetical protein DN069_09020 [Streptacidiphilus pinicola]